MFSLYIVWYVFLAGLGAGAFLLATWQNAVNRNEDLVSGPTGRLSPYAAGFLVAPLAFLLACVFLLADVGVPALVFEVAARPLQSIVSVGAWLVGLSTLVSLALGVLVVFGRSPRALVAALQAAGALLALGVLLYTGLLFSSLVTVEFWRTWLLVALFAVSGLSCGCAATAITCFALQGASDLLERTQQVDAVLLAAEAAVLVAFIVDRWLAGGDAATSVGLLVSGRYAVAFWGVVVALGLVVPLGLGVARGFTPGAVRVLAGGACGLLGGFALRYCIINAAVVSAIAFGPSYM